MTDERPNEPWLLRRLGLGDGPADLRFGWRIVAALLAIYAVSFALFYPEVPTNVDEAAYISQAVMLLEPEAEVIQIDPFTGDEVSMVLDTYPLGTALITAPLVALFGWRSAYAVACLAVLTMVILTGRVIASEGRTPVLALLLLGFPSVLVLGRVAMSDVPSGALVAFGLWLFWRGQDRHAGWWLAAGFVAGASWAFRASNPVLFAPLFAGSVLRRERQSVALVVGGLAGLAVRLVSQAVYFGDAFFERSSYKFAPDSLDERLPLYLLGLLVCVPGGLILSVLYRGRRRPEVIVTIVAFFLLYLFQRYSTIETSFPKRVVLALRYLIPMLPIMALATSESLPRLWKRQMARCEPGRRAHLGMLASWGLTLWLAGLALASAGVHPAFAAWSSTQGELRAAIAEVVPTDAVLLTNWYGTKKFIWQIERHYKTLDTMKVPPERVSELVERHGEVFFAIIDRNDSAWWRQAGRDNAEYLTGIPTGRQLLADVRPNSTDRLRIWRLTL